MAVGSKYAALTQWLQDSNNASVRMTFDELNKIITIPNHAYTLRASWANPISPASFSSGWQNAGYIVAAVNLQEQWVEFQKGTAKGYEMLPKATPRRATPKAINEVLACGYSCYDSIGMDPNHRYLSWEYCHEAFKKHRQEQDDSIIDYLCLHLAWYLASWGMLRNSFLMQKDYKIHTEIVRLIYKPEWAELWDISPEKLSQEWYAARIMKLSEEITEAYVASGAGIQTETLLTKILLGTLGCVPAYDRYFKEALSLTGAAPQRFGVKSIMALGKLYMDRKSEFEALKKYCSSRVEYPVAKVIDMCFFEYGFQRDAGQGDN